VVEVRWTLQAIDDLRSIADFIAKGSSHYARLTVIDLFLAVERLASFPRSGRIVPEIKNPAIREIILGNYRIIYRLQGRIIDVLAVHQGAKLLGPNRF
jgi:plasmid stabilization system protein ParE